MFKEIKLPFNLSFMEFLTLIFFFTLGYFGIYRYSFYNTLGIPWYLSYITPSQFITSSLECIISLFMASMICYLIYRLTQLFEKYQEKALRIITALFLIIFALNLFSIYDKSKFLSFLFDNKDFSTLSIFHYVVSIFLIRQLVVDRNKFIKNSSIRIEHIKIPENLLTPNHIVEKINNKAKAYSLFTIFLMSFIIIYTPYFLGKKDAYRLLINKESSSNLVKIKLDKDLWYLIEATGDKVLLVKKNKNDKLKNDFKLIEYKEIEKIVAKQKEDSDRVIFDYISENLNR